jgi:hypothetical protein
MHGYDYHLWEDSGENELTTTLSASPNQADEPDSDMPGGFCPFQPVRFG